MPQPPNDVSLFQYADDTAYLAVGNTVKQLGSKLQATLNDFSTWCKKWKLTVNSGKTQAVVILPRKRRTKCHRNPAMLTLTLNGHHITATSAATYLGVVFDDQLNWKAHLQHTVSNASNRLRLLQRLVGTTWGLKPETVLTTYKMFLRPVLTFGHIAWCSASSQFYERLNIIERHAIRLAYRIQLPYPNYLTYEHIDFPTISRHLTQLRLQYIRSRITTDHPLYLSTLRSLQQQTRISPTSHPALSILLTLYLQDPDVSLDTRNALAPFTVADHLPHIFPS